MARVFIVDDDGSVRELVEEIVIEAGHEVALQAATLQEALDLVPRARELGVQLAILDGSLSRGSPNDGAVIAEALRGAIPTVQIISLSAQKRAFGDVNLLKPLDPSSVLLQAVHTLLS